MANRKKTTAERSEESIPQTNSSTDSTAAMMRPDGLAKLPGAELAPGDLDDEEALSRRPDPFPYSESEDIVLPEGYTPTRCKCSAALVKGWRCLSIIWAHVLGIASRFQIVFADDIINGRGRKSYNHVANRR